VPAANSITQILQTLRNGDKQALDRLMPLVYAELRRLASGYLRGERPEHTLQPTALVHEAYMRLVGQEQPEYQSRAHFFGVAAQVMRQILVDHARRCKAAKRGSGAHHVPLTDAATLTNERASVVVALDDAMEALRQLDERKAKLVEMRFFGGLTAEESATVLDVPVNTVRRDLRVAQAWLQRELDRNLDAAAES
jgi:RNA polymerase sigma factor (TIGR02999 family)